MSAANYPIVQTGTVTYGHVAQWVTDGVVKDGGTATNGTLTEVGITKNGGIAVGVNSLPITSVAGYSQLGYGIDSSGKATFYANSYGGAPACSVFFNINGIVYPFPGAGGGDVIGPGPVTAGDLVSFNGGSGSLIQDSGISVAQVTDLYTNSVLVVPSIAVLRAATSSTFFQGQCYVEGWSSKADGGEGTFIYVPSDTTSADNGGTIIVDSSGRRWHRQFAADGPVSLLWFGGDTVSDYSPLLTAALAASPNIFLPAGVLPFASSVAYTFPNNTASLRMIGSGTTLNWATAENGLTINFLGPLNSIQIRDMTLTTGLAPATGAAITLNQAAALGSRNAANQSDFTNVNVRGSDGPNGANYWQVGIQNNGVSCINFTNFRLDGISGSAFQTVGSGVVLVGTASIIPVIFNFVGCQFNYIGTGIVYGAYVQGVTVSQCNFVGGSVGIGSPSSASGTVLSELSVVASQFNCASYGIQTITAIAGTNVSSSYFFVSASGAVGIFLEQTLVFSLVGNSFNGPTPTPEGAGIQIGTNPASLPGAITGNSFFRLGAGVVLTSGSSLVNVQSNAYASNTTNVANTGTSNTVGGGSP